jgi:hypothetical protein
MRLRMLSLVAAIAIVAVPRAQVAIPRPLGYVAVKTAAPLTIDGKLDEPAWTAAKWTEPFVDIEGASKPKPALNTRAKMLWDDS